MLHIKRAALIAGLALLTSTAGASAQSRLGADVDVNIDVNRNDRVRTDRQVIRERRETTTTGSVNRRDERGGNREGFCPPGQAKKAGRGSAFNC